MDAIFPPGQDIEVGPVQVWKLRLYGPDITYPLDHVLMQTAGVLAQSLLNNYVGFQSRVGRAALTRGAATRLRTAGGYKEPHSHFTRNHNSREVQMN
jgi:hypothetical protein